MSDHDRRFVIAVRAARNGGMTLNGEGPQIQSFQTQAGREPTLEIANVAAVENGATHLQEGIGASLTSLHEAVALHALADDMVTCGLCPS